MRCINIIYRLVFFLFLLKNIWGCVNENRSNANAEKKPNDSIENVSKSALSDKIKFPKTYFSDPEVIKNGDTSRIIVHNLIKFIDAAVSNSDIYINIYQFEDKTLARSLVDADTRGVDVHVLMDSSKTKSWNGNKCIARYLQDSLNNSPGSEVVLYNND